jgi:hypothetical protein
MCGPCGWLQSNGTDTVAHCSAGSWACCAAQVAHAIPGAGAPPAGDAPACPETATHTADSTTTHTATTTERDNAHHR